MQVRLVELILQLAGQFIVGHENEGYTPTRRPCNKQRDLREKVPVLGRITPLHVGPHVSGFVLVAQC
jgi:hypothetical protein